MTAVNEPATDERCFADVCSYRLAMAGFGLLLFAVTWRLWTPQTVFPQIPFFATLTAAPSWIDWLAIAIAVVSLTIAGASRQAVLWKQAAIVFSIALTILVLLDQHRFQPWAYQLVVFFVIMASCRERAAARLMQWIVASIYVYSAISKLDYQFLHSLGPQFLETLLRLVGISTETWSATLLAAAATLFPLGELCVGVGLLYQRTRRMAVVLAIATHVLLLLILGPLGLGHQPGVLVWNLFFIVQAVILFANWPLNASQQDNDSHRPISEPLGYVVAGLVIAFPLTESFGCCDHWPAWELYSPRSSRAFVAIHESATDRLPASIQPFLAPPTEGNAWRQLYLDRWSLETLAVPIYPEDRFHLAVALALAEQHDLQLAIHVTQQTASSRSTGARKERTYRGYEQLAAATRKFHVNQLAR